MKFPSLICVVVLTVMSSASAENWPSWRGPRGDGTSIEKGFPLTWSPTENIAWKTPIPGTGHSSPIVWGDRVFVSSCVEKEENRILVCVDRTNGNIVWDKVVLKSPLEKKHGLNSYASSTPATDGKYVYVTFFDKPKMVVVCYDFDGREIWRKSPGEFKSQHGFCSPPILYENMVIINGDQDALAYVVALDKATGEEKWRTDRPNRTRSYCPPLIVEAAGKKQMVMTGSKSVASYDPNTGKQIWVMDGPTEQFVASMVYHKDLFFLTAGFPTYHLMAIKPDGVGKISKSHEVWHHTKGAGYVPSPIAFGENLFNVTDAGVACCVNCEKGDFRWMERLGSHHSASPVVSSDGILYFTDDDGTTFVLKATSEFAVMHKNKLGEKCFASPAMADGQIFLRGTNHLFCIGKK